eukprot:CAMPEP_0172574712 /NCGR_PEP_ID=MMETSP1067-20121228/136842_1 /TAXON_ID=265564 ORGANISM="Thalassiosira punctigera, Strain Tpunct2005C2" /NCGR_SAMPLE_ID=MMETSP1067 /ASSEMBLY_ACC=CAM_ASM_000444 /LENGTH=319 /DNA_ID=CAMNT_0013367345 /DNA_START=113 /DNA_END=1070 /DNA_ORIENTATION=-
MADQRRHPRTQEDVFLSIKGRAVEEGGRGILPSRRSALSLLDENLTPGQDRRNRIASTTEGDPNGRPPGAFAYARHKYQDRALGGGHHLLGRTSPSIGAGPCRALEGARTGPAIMRSVPRRPTWGERPSIGAGGGGTSAAFDRFRTISKKSRAEIAAGILDGGRSRCDPGAKYGEGRLAGSLASDPCNATLLICLESCATRGAIPAFRRWNDLRRENGEGCGILFVSSNKIGEDASRDLASDPCNATLLICLESCATRGAIPAFRRWNDLRRENGEGCGILFVSSNKIGEDASRDASSLHHGGKVLRGEKVAVQLMLDW